MGLDTSHNCWSGPYSSFNAWRRAICKAADFPWLESVRSEAVLIGEWDTEPEDILSVLMEHQDCEGRIYPKHCWALADRLEALLPKLSDQGHHSPRSQTLRFIDGLRMAAKANEPVEFH